VRTTPKRLAGRVQQEPLLEVPLTEKQIDAANELHATVEQWREEARALELLRKALPGWSRGEAIIKCVVINSLYGTNVYAIVRMAEHVSKTLGPKFDERQLVERVAQLEGRNHVSFASKLCHVFVSEDTFPIYDSVACETLRLHLGRRYIGTTEARYQAFLQNLSVLREYASIGSGARRLDRYLWLVGLCRRWIKRGRPINTEFGRVLSELSSQQRALLHRMLPRCVDREFRFSMANARRR
jgi:hypothetical protein